MKRCIAIVMIVLFFAACGAESAVEDTAANLSARKGDRVTIEVDRVWTDMRPLSNTNRASVLFRLEIVEDAALLGADEPIMLYGGGTLIVDQAPPSWSWRDVGVEPREVGSGRMEVCSGDTVGEANGLFYPCGLPVLSLTAQIDGLMAETAEVTIIGVATTSNAKEEILEFRGFSLAEQAELGDARCYGRLIPGSNLAQIMVTGDGANGESVQGGGLLRLGTGFSGPADNSGPFDCAVDGRSGIAFAEGQSISNDLRLFRTVMDTLTSEFFENYDPKEFQNVEAFLIG